MNSVLYFQLRLTEVEHIIMEDEIYEWILKVNTDQHVIRLSYYRELTPHVPMVREVKLTGQKIFINRFKKWFADKRYVDFIVEGKHKDEIWI